jgi:hypothetical protein
MAPRARVERATYCLGGRLGPGMACRCAVRAWPGLPVTDRQLPLPPARSGTSVARRDRAATMFLSCFPTHAVALIFPSAVDPPVRGAGQAVGVQVERPAGRMTWTPTAWSAGLVPGRRRAG